MTNTPHSQAGQKTQQVSSDGRILLQAKKYTYIAASCFVMFNASVPVVLVGLGSHVYSRSSIYTNSVIILATGVLVLLLMRNIGIKIIERCFLFLTVGYVLTWDVARILQGTIPLDNNDYRHLTALVGCAIICVCFPHRVGIYSMAAFLSAHFGLMWANLARYPWSKFHYFQIDETIMTLTLASVLALASTYQFVLGKRSQLAAVQEITHETDHLTKLPNRVSAIQQLEYAKSCTAFMINLDNFSLVNAERGLSFGDVALREVADYLRELFPGKALVSRWGGNEFLVIVSDKSDVNLSDCVTRMRDSLDVMIPGFPVTACYAVATKGARENHESFLARCSQLMMAAKAIGADVFLTDQADDATDVPAAAESNA